MDSTRSILKRYAISLLCFGVFGLVVLQIYVTGYDNVTNHWSVDPLPLPLALLAGLFGLMTYFPFILFAGNAPMLVASAIFTFFSIALDHRGTHIAWGAGAGAIAASLAAIVTRIPEVALTPMAWWQGTAQGWHDRRRRSRCNRGAAVAFSAVIGRQCGTRGRQ